MTIDASTWSAAVNNLAAVVAGEVMTSGDPAWDDARSAWNLVADRRPSLVAVPTNVADVVAVIDFSRFGELAVGTVITDTDTGADAER
jgi:hypothetical protein